MKTLVKTVIILVIGIFCFACTPNLPDIPIYIHQSGWGHIDDWGDNRVTETMQRSSNGSFLYIGTWKGGEVELSETNLEDDRSWWGVEILTLGYSDISGETNLSWGDIVKYIYYPSSQSLEVVPTGATPSYYCYCDYTWRKMDPDKDGTFSCVAYHDNDYIYINTLVPPSYSEDSYGALEFYRYYSSGTRVKYTFNPKTKSLTTTEL